MAPQQQLDTWLAKLPQNRCDLGGHELAMAKAEFKVCFDHYHPLGFSSETL
jgi:hypothetical protein